MELQKENPINSKEVPKVFSGDCEKGLTSDGEAQQRSWLISQTDSAPPQGQDLFSGYFLPQKLFLPAPLPPHPQFKTPLLQRSIA